MQKADLERLLPPNQRHLLRFWDELDEAQQGRLAQQICSIDFAQIERLVHGAVKQDNWAALAQRAQPPEAFRLDGKGNKFTLQQARAAGEAALKRGEIGAILVAGGQGTRMGFDKPKGMYSIGPVSGASLFQILLERLIAVGRRYGVELPLYVMTSDATHADTQEYFDENNRFGLSAENVRLFCQGTMPAVDTATGQLLLAGKGELALSPDGHGGMLAAMVTSGALADIRRRGIKTLFYFQVDNPLAEVCDPAFLGYHILAKSEMSTLAVAKREPLERVGNVVQIDGRTRIIEYSDLPEEVAKRPGSDGKPQLWAGNTAIHVLDVAFLERVQGQDEALPFHTARKKVAHIDEQGKPIEPTEPNAFKFERFIFDLLPAAQRAIVVEADAAQSFAPVKNAPGDKRDSPDTAQEMMVALHRKWLEAAGAKVAPNVLIEISPLFALDATELKAKIKSGTLIDEATYFRAEHGV